ncbi:MAG: hypothetical protein PHU64_02235 [Candidatus Omnitrophica bacterium]|nr:hypothetical protein [Candidatus Omnitrophota bacterium]MDD5429894.1 hypothetical protein [Candidatus Omnitrophota bacterium]
MKYYFRKDTEIKKICHSRKAQSFLEYSLIVAVSVATLLVMRHYASRSLQGKLKESVDSLGGEYIAAAFNTPLPESGYRVSGADHNKVGQADSIVTSVNNLTRSTVSFTYEGERGFAVTTSSSAMHQEGEIKD